MRIYRLGRIFERVCCKVFPVFYNRLVFEELHQVTRETIDQSYG